MGLWSRLFGKKDKAADTPLAQWLFDWVEGSKTLSGERVSAESSLKLSAVWACVRVRSEDIAKLPLVLYQRLPDGSKQRAENHPLYWLLKERPNTRMTSFEFRQIMQTELDLRGNALALKEFNGRGRVVALWPVCWDRVKVLSSPDGKQLFYEVRDQNGALIDTFPSDGVLHLRGLTLDGMVGLSPVAYHRETIGLAIAAQKYGSAFFGNSAQPRGGIKVPAKLDAVAADMLRKSWEEKYRGVENSNKIAIFDGGMEYVQTGMDNTDAQYIETRNLQNSEIWRIYRMPPHKVGDLSKATFSNIEQQSLEYVTDCLMSELVRWEQTLKRDLLLDSEQSNYFFEFNVDALLRGDFMSRMNGYAIARNWGIFSANDCRDKENLNRVEDGDIYLQPLNMVEAGTPPPPAPSVSPDAAKFLKGMLAKVTARDALLTSENDRNRERIDAMGARISDALKFVESAVSNKQEPAPINVNVSPPAINITMPETNISVPERQMSLELNMPEPGAEDCEVKEHFEDGRIKKWTKTPARKRDGESNL